MTTAKSERKAPILHKLKIHPVPFKAWRDGLKRSEFRVNDRDYHMGDTVQLHEFDPKQKKNPFTGKALQATISHIEQSSKYGVPKGYCVLCLQSPQFLSPDHHETPKA